MLILISDAVQTSEKWLELETHWISQETYTVQQFWYIYSLCLITLNIVWFIEMCIRHGFNQNWKVLININKSIQHKM
jgi:hypothetical protein